MTEVISTAGGVVSALVALAAFLVAQRSKAESKRTKEAEEYRHQLNTRIDSKIDAMGERLEDVSERVDRISSDLAEVKTKVAVHDDRMNRPPYLAAVKTQR